MCGQRRQLDKRGQRACLLGTAPNSPSQKVGIIFVDTGLPYVWNKLRIERHCVCATRSLLPTDSSPDVWLDPTDVPQANLPLSQSTWFQRQAQEKGNLTVSALLTEVMICMSDK